MRVLTWGSLSLVAFAGLTACGVATVGGGVSSAPVEALSSTNDPATLSQVLGNPTLPDVCVGRRIWPDGADATTCEDLTGNPVSVTGPNSFNLLEWDGCGTWRSFPTEPSRPIVVVGYTDTCAGCYAENVQFSLVDGGTVVGTYHAAGAGASVVTTYVPGSGPVQLVAGPSAAFYFAVFEACTAPIAATVTLEPQVLNLESRGRWVEATLQLPAGYDPSTILVSTVAITQVGMFATHLSVAPRSPVEIDTEQGVRVLEVKFDRRALEGLLVPTDAVSVTVTGSLTSGESFEGAATLRVLAPHRDDGDDSLQGRDSSHVPAVDQGGHPVQESDRGEGQPNPADRSSLVAGEASGGESGGGGNGKGVGTPEAQGSNGGVRAGNDQQGQSTAPAGGEGAGNASENLQPQPPRAQSRASSRGTGKPSKDPAED